MPTIKILGIDAALSNTGYVVAEIDCATSAVTAIHEHGTIITAPSKVKKVRKSSDALERARSIANYLNAVIKDNDIRIATAEVPSGAQSASACYAFGIAVGILASLPVSIIEVSQRETKMASVGSSTADKEDIVRWAVERTQELGGLQHWNLTKGENDWGIKVGDRFVTKTNEHQADAIAVVYAALKTEQFRQLAAVINLYA